MTRPVKIIAAFCTALLFSPLAVDESVAASCAALQASLKGGQVSNKAGRYRAAIAKQRAALTEMRKRADRCGGSGRQCRDTHALVSRMQSNLAKLERNARRLGGEASRQQIVARLKAKGCPGYGRVKPSRQKATLAAYRATPTKASRHPAFQAFNGLSSGQRWRTVCVRKSDGYFFPISFSSRRSEFARDEALCRQSCPDGPVTLFIHPSHGEPDQMVSLSGARYADQSFAYRFHEYPPRNGLKAGCQAATGLRLLAQAEPTTRRRVVVFGLSREAVTRAADGQPGEIAEASSGEEPDPVPASAPAKKAPAPLRDLPEGPIRAVGPTFFPDQEAKPGLRVPGPLDAQ